MNCRATAKGRAAPAGARVRYELPSQALHPQDSIVRIVSVEIGGS